MVLKVDGVLLSCQILHTYRTSLTLACREFLIFQGTLTTQRTRECKASHHPLSIQGLGHTEVFPLLSGETHDHGFKPHQAQTWSFTPPEILSTHVG